ACVPFAGSRPSQVGWACSLARRARTPDGDRVTPMTANERLRLETVHHAVGIVVEREFRTWCAYEAFTRFIGGFVGVATAVNNDARPCSGIGRFVLPI